MGTGEWAQAQCSGPVKASMLFRGYNQGAAITEAGVNASTSTVTLPPEGHQTYNICTWVNQNLSGSVQIVSRVPIVSLSLNGEAPTPAAPGGFFAAAGRPGQLDVASIGALRKTAKSGLEAWHRAPAHDEFASEVD